MRYKTALVTGGAGFIGSHIVEGLLQRGLEVFVLDDLSTGKQAHVPRAARFVQGDIRDSALMEKLVAEADIVFHQAARVSVRNSVAGFYDDASVNVLGTLNVLDGISKTRRAGKLVYASSMAVYGEAGTGPISEDHPTDPMSPYGIGKLASEKYCLQVGKQCGVDVVVLRYFNTFGLRQTFTPYVGVITIFINTMLQNKTPMIFGDGEQMRDFVAVEDVAGANILAMESRISNGIFNIGSGKGTTINEIFQLIRDKVHADVTPQYCPRQPGELRNSVADISLAGGFLQYKPTLGFTERMDALIDWWKAQPADVRCLN